MWRPREQRSVLFCGVFHGLKTWPRKVPVIQKICSLKATTDATRLCFKLSKFFVSWLQNQYLGDEGRGVRWRCPVVGRHIVMVQKPHETTHPPAPELLERTETESQTKANLLISAKMKQRHFLVKQDACFSVVCSCRGLTECTKRCNP